MAALSTTHLLWILPLLCFVHCDTSGNATPSKEASYFENESKLFSDLLSNYNRFIRPAVENEAVNVSLGVSLLHINNVDEKLGTLHVQGWTRMMWQDARLSWNGEDYGGIHTIRIPPQQLWTPDVTLYNSAEQTTELLDTSQLALVTSSGHIIWIPVTILHSKCTFDMSYFPFDKQQCTLTFGSWTYNGYMVDFNLYDGQQEIDTSHFSEHMEWDFGASIAGVKTVKYECCPEPYPKVEFDLTLVRKRTYFSYMYIAPPFLLSHLIPLMFVLPAAQPHRYILGMGLLITMTLLLENIAWVIPSLNGDVPILCRYYIGVFVMSFLSLVCSALITNIANRAKGPSHPANIIKIICSDVLGRLFCVPRPQYSHMSTYSRDTDEVEVTGPEQRKRPKDLDQISEWTYIARVLDRLFGVVFTILVAVLALTHLLHAEPSNHGSFQSDVGRSGLTS